MSSRNAVVTGAARGIGAAVAERLMREGWRVIGLDKEFRGVGGDERYADVTDRATIECALDGVARIDAVVSNAGVMERTPITQIDADRWRWTIETNLSATFHLLQVTHRRLAAGSGAFVAISSVHALATSSGAAAYAAAKAGLLGLVRGAAIELASDGVRVNAVVPGAVDTAMLGQTEGERVALVSRTPLRRIGKPEEIASAVAFLLSDEAAFMTAQTLVVDGGVMARLSSE